ncbi:XRE family transcriptional regulator [Weissella tructae]|uniref:XRE family transcriptional regulator n=1 Tax=Weissella tructae TaxID=887702 RepID=UPI003D8E4C42
MTEKTKTIKHLMVDADVNQTGIAKQFGWSGGYVSRLIRGGELGPAAIKNTNLVIVFLEEKINATS